MTHVTCRLTAKNRDQRSGKLRCVIAYGLPLPFPYMVLYPPNSNRIVTVESVTPVHPMYHVDCVSEDCVLVDQEIARLQTLENLAM